MTGPLLLRILSTQNLPPHAWQRALSAEAQAAIVSAGGADEVAADSVPDQPVIVAAGSTGGVADCTVAAEHGVGKRNGNHICMTRLLHDKGKLHLSGTELCCPDLRLPPQLPPRLLPRLLPILIF